MAYTSSLRSVVSNSAYYYKKKLAPELPLEAPVGKLKMEDTGLISLPREPVQVKPVKKKGKGKKVLS